MAEKNLSPRQKMISMMYLVLTAMLALNVQREVLDAFVMLNGGIERAGVQQEAENNNLFAQFQMASSLDPVKTKPWLNAASDIRLASKEVRSMLDSLHIELTVETEGLTHSEADTLQLRFVEKQEDYNEVTRIMVGDEEDGSEGKGLILRQTIERFTTDVNGLLQEKNLEAVQLPIDFSDGNKEGKILPWEVISFYDMPFVAAMTLLEKIRNDVQRFEGEAMQRLLGELDAEDFPIDTVLAKVIPRSPYVMLGETYEADVFLGGFSRTLSPQVFVGEVDQEGNPVEGSAALDVTNGMGHYAVKANREGVQTYSGVVQMANKRGDTRSFPFSSSYIVARPSAVVSPTKMNVLYKGVENPIDVSVPGVSSDKVRVSLQGNGKISQSGEGYEVKLENSAHGEVSVVVQAEIDGTWMEMGRQKFRVKPLPAPYVRFGSVKGSGKLTAIEASLAFMKAEYSPDFPFDLPVNVVSFKMEIRKPDGTPIDRDSQSKILTPDMKVNIQQAKRGQQILFKDIIAQGEDGVRIPVSPIVVTIKR